MPSAVKYKAVLFDLGETLIRTTNVPEIFRRILETYGVRVVLNDVARAHEQNVKEYDVREMAELGVVFWIKWNVKILKRLGIERDREFLARKIDELWWDYADLEVYPDVLETLAQLRAKGIKLGIVTNGMSRDFQQILSRLGLTDWFDVVVGVDACKKAKPDVEIFRYALNKLNVRPEEALFVGNSVEHDFEGAKKAGLRPLLINRDEKAPTSAETIRSLTEVLTYV